MLTVRIGWRARATHLRIQVIAEGTAAYQQAEILLRVGCTVGRGFLFALSAGRGRA